MKDKIILILVIGILVLLSKIVGGALYVSITEGKEVNEDVITLIKMSMTGLIGVIAGYMGSSDK